MNSEATLVDPDQLSLRAARLCWRRSLWPVQDGLIWDLALHGKGPDGLDNPAASWRPDTAEKNAYNYGRYLSWLFREGLLGETDDVTERITPERVARYIAHLKSFLAPTSVGIDVGGLCSTARALAPHADWCWLSHRATRLKYTAKPSREKRYAIQHTRDLYRFGKRVMDTADRGKGQTVSAAQRYQSGLVIALLAARPLRIRNFQAITIHESLRWEGGRYWLTFPTEDTKMRRPINEPVPDDLVPYLEAFLRVWRPVLRPVLVRQSHKFGGNPTHRRLWVDRFGKAMTVATLRDLIERYTGKEFGAAIWPHLFRDCLLTSVAIDQPDLMSITASLLEHASSHTGKHYNQARMLDASRRYGATISELRESFFDPQPDRRRGSKE